MDSMKIVVLAGGLSTERNVSLVTGTSACRALRERGHRAVLVDMFLGLESYEGPWESLFDAADGLCGDAAIQAAEPDLAAVRAERADQGPSCFGRGVLDLCALADIVFLALHGACGEDGRVQATFDLLGIPYTGAGYLSSGMAMDKIISKQVMDRVGIPTAPWQEVYYGREDIPALAEQLPVPCAVKIANGGSSIGVALPDDRAQLADALESILKYGSHVLVEQKIKGRELTVGVLGDRYLPAVEIIPQSGAYFDYESKYQAGGSLEICPARISDELWREVGELALRLHRGLGLSGYSRTDFILDENDRPYCLEINTLPGLTPASLLPKEAAAAGIAYGELCEEIIRLSLEARKGERL